MKRTGTAISLIFVRKKLLLFLLQFSPRIRKKDINHQYSVIQKDRIPPGSGIL